MPKGKAREPIGPRAAISRRSTMTSKLRKAAIGALAALTLGAGITATATPSAAQGWRGGRWHAGYWHRGYGWHGGYGWGGPVAAGVIGGLALGALAGSAYAYGP